MASIPVAVFIRPVLYGIGGLWAGGLVSVIVLVSMNMTIAHAVHMEKGQAGYLAVVSAVRMLFVGAFMAAVVLTERVSLLAALVGLLGLKVSVYLAPTVEKLIDKVTNK